jgi:hypothetical protein
MEVYEESCVVCGDGPYVSSFLLLVARYCDYTIWGTARVDASKPTLAQCNSWFMTCRIVRRLEVHGKVR